MDTPKVETYFAPSERASAQDIENDYLYFASQPFVTAMLDAIPDIVLILNAQRQTVFANENAQ